MLKRSLNYMCMCSVYDWVRAIDGTRKNLYKSIEVKPIKNQTWKDNEFNKCMYVSCMHMNRNSTYMHIFPINQNS